MNYLKSFVECSNYTFLNESDRAMTYAERSLGNLSDSKLSGWYRFSGGAGTQMAEACPKMYSCSTNSSGWLNGSHPTVAQGIVERKVCFSQRVSQFLKDCCNYSKNISVRNCGAFYVYRLDPPDYYSRYCGNGLPQAPGENEFFTSSILLSRMTFTSEMSNKSHAFARDKGASFLSVASKHEKGFRTSLEYRCFWLNVSKTQMLMKAINNV